MKYASSVTVTSRGTLVIETEKHSTELDLAHGHITTWCYLDETTEKVEPVQIATAHMTVVTDYINQWLNVPDDPTPQTYHDPRVMIDIGDGKLVDMLTVLPNSYFSSTIRKAIVMTMLTEAYDRAMKACVVTPDRRSGN